MCKNMRIIYLLTSVIVSCFFLASCSAPKESLTYFENIDSVSIEGIGSNKYGVKIVPDDELKIVVTSQQPEATAAYNLPLANYADRSKLENGSVQSLQTYVVDKKGYIVMPVLGEIYVEGKTTDEIETLIKERISLEVKDPYVSVRLLSFKINVLGEVKNPGVINVRTERFSLLDALSVANDMTVYGKRENVLLIREEGGVKKCIRLNLNDKNILESPYYYLQQNDVVYVEPNKIRKDNSKYNQSHAYKLSVISTIVSACSVIASLVIALLATK